MKTISIYCAQYNEGDTMTLAQLAQEVEAQERESLKTGNFESFGDFLSYYRQHYRPILEQVAGGITPTGDNARLLRLLASDLLDIFKEDSAESKDEDEGTRIMNVEDMGEPSQNRPTFYEAAREFIENHYNHSTDRDQIAAFMAEDISRAAAEVFGKSRAAYLLDAISCRVQSWCNPALNDEDGE